MKTQQKAQDGAVSVYDDDDDDDNDHYGESVSSPDYLEEMKANEEPKPVPDMLAGGKPANVPSVSNSRTKRAAGDYVKANKFPTTPVRS